MRRFAPLAALLLTATSAASSQVTVFAAHEEGATVSIPMLLATEDTIASVTLDVSWPGGDLAFTGFAAAPGISVLTVPSASGGRLSLGLGRDADCDALCCAYSSGTFMLGTLELTRLAGAATAFPLSLCAGSGMRCDGATGAFVPADVACANGLVAGCGAGSIHVPRTGDTRLDLADLIASARIVRVIDSPTSEALLCGDAAPGFTTCEGVGAGWCRSPDGVLDAADVAVVRRLMGGGLVEACFTCDAQPAPRAILPGDAAPRSAPDGVVDVSDAVQVLRWSAGLDPSQWDDVDARTAADVAPLGPDGASHRDRVLDVADAVLVLRAAVGLETLAWPLVEAVLHVDAAGPFNAVTTTLGGFPLLQSGAPELLCDGCDPLASGVEATRAGWSVTLSRDPFTWARSSDVARIRFRAPGPVNVSTIFVRETQVADIELDVSYATASVR